MDSGLALRRDPNDQRSCRPRHNHISVQISPPTAATSTRVYRKIEKHGGLHRATTRLFRTLDDALRYDQQIEARFPDLREDIFRESYQVGAAPSGRSRKCGHRAMLSIDNALSEQDVTTSRSNRRFRAACDERSRSRRPKIDGNSSRSLADGARARPPRRRPARFGGISPPCAHPQGRAGSSSRRNIPAMRIRGEIT